MNKLSFAQLLSLLTIAVSGTETMATTYPWTIFDAKEACEEHLPSGRHRKCWSGDFPLSIIEPIAETRDRFINGLKFTTDLSYTYACRGVVDKTAIAFGSDERLIAFSPVPVQISISHLMHPSDKIRFIRKSDAIDVLEPDCTFVLNQGDTYLDTPALLETYVVGKLAALSRSSSIVADLQGSLDSVQVKANLLEAINQIQGQLNALQTQYEDISFSSAADKEEQLGIVNAKLQNARTSLAKVQDLLRILDINCALDGQAQSCTNFLSTTVSGLLSENQTLNYEISEVIKPWVDSELLRLTNKVSGISEGLQKAKTKLENVQAGINENTGAGS